MKNSSDTIGDRNRDLLACSACLNQLRHRVSPYYIIYYIKWYIYMCVYIISLNIYYHIFPSGILSSNQSLKSRCLCVGMLVHLNCYPVTKHSRTAVCLLHFFPLLADHAHLLFQQVTSSMYINCIPFFIKQFEMFLCPSVRRTYKKKKKPSNLYQSNQPLKLRT